MNTSKIVAIALIILVLINGALIVANQPVQPEQTPVQNEQNTVQFKTDIYHHLTVYSDNIGGDIFVIEIDVDDTIPVGCDGWLGDDENGHNCVLVGNDSIREVISLYNLPYENVKGE